MSVDLHNSADTLELLLPPDTSRLRFRPILPDDHEHVRSIYADSEALRFLPDLRNADGVQKFIDRQIGRYAIFGYGIWLLETLDRPRVVGDAGITWQETDRGDVMEIGYGLCKAERGHGYALEAARACLGFAFEVLGATFIASLVDANNTASRRVAAKLHAHDREFTHPRLGPGYIMYYTEHEV